MERLYYKHQEMERYGLMCQNKAGQMFLNKRQLKKNHFMKQLLFR